MVWQASSFFFFCVSIAIPDDLGCVGQSGNRNLDNVMKSFQSVVSAPITCESELSYADLVAATETVFAAADTDADQRLDSVCLNMTPCLLEDFSI